MCTKFNLDLKLQNAIPWRGGAFTKPEYHPALIHREGDIDDLMKRWKEESYHIGLK
jgi:hypothetical protein